MKNPPSWWMTIQSIRWLAGLGYLFTVLRFSHGVSQLCAAEKDSIEGSNPPSSLRILLLFLFLSWLGILFYLMADNITNFKWFLIWTALMLLLDFLYIAFSAVVRDPFRAMFIWIPGQLVHSERIVWDWCKDDQSSRLKKPIKKRLEKIGTEGRADRVSWLKTEPGYLADAAAQWIISDLVLVVICLLFLLVPVFNRKPHERWFGVILIAAAAADYLANRTFYFGGRGDKRKAKMVFVCSPLTDGNVKTAEEVEAHYREGISRAKKYALDLMQQKRRIIPFAAQAFYSYFLRPTEPKDRNIINECSLTFLRACDALYVYVPCSSPVIDLPFLFRTNGRPNLERTNVSDQMKCEIEEARRLGLQIRYKKMIDPEIEKRTENEKHKWRLTVPPTDRVSVVSKEKQNPTERKRVYVCTPLRGIGWDGQDLTTKKGTLNKNIKQALRECYRLTHEEEELIAPFAPQAFYPYLLEMLEEPPEKQEKRWKTDWFYRSKEVLKICDAMYVYGEHGSPNDPISGGMKELVTLAENLGMEIQYRKLKTFPEDWNPTLPEFGANIIDQIDFPKAAASASQRNSSQTGQSRDTE